MPTPVAIIAVLRTLPRFQENENVPSYQNEIRAFLNSSAFISVNYLKMANTDESPYGVLGTSPKFGLREEIEFAPEFTSSKHRCKRNFTVVFVQVVKKSVLDVQFFFFSFTNWAHCRRRHRRLRRCSQGLSMCVNGYESEHILVKMPAIFSLVRYICYSRFSPLMDYFVSPETEIWVERPKKNSVDLEKKNYFKETNRIE